MSNTQLQSMASEDKNVHRLREEREKENANIEMTM
jgi:hypothetical protein